MKWCIVLLVLVGCAGAVSPGDPCPVRGQIDCASVSNNDRIIVLCDGTTYGSIGTCQTEACAPSDERDSVTCDGVRRADQSAPCSAEGDWACQALGGKLLACRNGRWASEYECSSHTESCVPNDGQFKFADGGVPDVRCHGD